MNSILKSAALKGSLLINLIKKHKVTSVIIGILLVIVAFLTIKSLNKTELSVELESNPTVEVQSVREMISGRVFNSVGTIESVSEARLQTESGGRITAVYADIGDKVLAGKILATLENASERAFLLQAEGSYEGALAAAAQGSVGVTEAENALTSSRNNAIAANASAYTDVSGIVKTKLDQYFSNPEGKLVGLRISGEGNTQTLNTARRNLQTTLSNWQAKTTTLTPSDDLKAALALSQSNANEVISMVDIFLTIFSSIGSSLTDEEIKANITEMNSVRSQLLSTIDNLRDANTRLVAAEEVVSRAKLSGSTNSGVTSSAEAQVKQALGSLRAAQANFEKTLVRTPISGVVNAFYLKTGDYVSPSTPAGIVANNNGLEVTTSVSQDDSVKIAVGDIVYLDKTATGTISAIAGAIDPTTGKVAVKISINPSTNLKNGNTVSIKFSTQSEKQDQEISIPLSAIKMTGSGPVVFAVNENGELKDMPVVLGPVTGSNVVITEGVDLDSQIVVDARGLKAGQVVTTLIK